MLANSNCAPADAVDVVACVHSFQTMVKAIWKLWAPQLDQLGALAPLKALIMYYCCVFLSVACAVEYSPFYGIEKGAVLQEARIFHDPNLDTRRCSQVCGRGCNPHLPSTALQLTATQLGCLWCCLLQDRHADYALFGFAGDYQAAVSVAPRRDLHQGGCIAAVEQELMQSKTRS